MKAKKNMNRMADQAIIWNVLLSKISYSKRNYLDKIHIEASKKLDNYFVKEWLIVVWPFKK